jgi:hypothetical protein
MHLCGEKRRKTALNGMVLSQLRHVYDTINYVTNLYFPSKTNFIEDFQKVAQTKNSYLFVMFAYYSIPQFSAKTTQQT